MIEVTAVPGPSHRALLLAAIGLRGGQLAVLKEIAHAAGTQPTVWLAQRELATRTGMTRQAVQRIIGRLRRFSPPLLLTNDAEWRRGERICYAVSWPALESVASRRGSNVRVPSRPSLHGEGTRLLPGLVEALGSGDGRTATPASNASVGDATVGCTPMQPPVAPPCNRRLHPPTITSSSPSEKLLKAADSCLARDGPERAAAIRNRLKAVGVFNQIADRLVRSWPSDRIEPRLKLAELAKRFGAPANPAFLVVSIDRDEDLVISDRVKASMKVEREREQSEANRLERLARLKADRPDATDAATVRELLSQYLKKSFSGR